MKENDENSDALLKKYGFTFDESENEWDNKKLKLCLIRIQKMDMHESRWSLSKFDDSHEDGEFILFSGTEDEVFEFIGKYIRENKLKSILDVV
jgi:hypothetical protein